MRSNIEEVDERALVARFYCQNRARRAWCAQQTWQSFAGAILRSSTVWGRWGGVGGWAGRGRRAGGGGWAAADEP